ncbi:hypothetical protein U0070_019796 [Myodes glareolus]|uniref:Uncharacterized protein n=1 Tax=Myodes glareolus TaxID=447135 RepID=A0AAW0JBV9_MYOGA
MVASTPGTRSGLEPSPVFTIQQQQETRVLEGDSLPFALTHDVTQQCGQELGSPSTLLLPPPLPRPGLTVHTSEKREKLTMLPGAAQDTGISEWSSGFMSQAQYLSQHGSIYTVICK